MALFLQQQSRQRLAGVGTLLLLWFTAVQAQVPVFDAASVRPAPSNPGARSSMKGGPETSDPGQITYTNVSLSAVLLRAYDLKAYQLMAPGWLGSERYDLAAKIPPGTSMEQFRQMLQNLLAERFQLTQHREVRPLQGFELVVARSGPKLKPSSPADPGRVPAPDAGVPPKSDARGFPRLDGPGLAMMEGVRGKAVISYLAARAQPISALAEFLSKEFRLPILEKTGLTGTFDFTLEFAPQPPGALPSASMEVPPDADDAAPNLITAVQQQLGLRLNPSKVPTNILVVDSAVKVPAGN